MHNKKYTLGAIMFDDFELLDMYGPLEMWGEIQPEVEIVMVSETSAPVKSYQGPKTVVDYTFETCPPLDIILIPGGRGTPNTLRNSAMSQFLMDRVPQAELTMTVCTGSWTLAALGFLDGRKATSNKGLFEITELVSPKVEWIPNARWVEDGPFYTSSGVTAGMDMSLAVISKMFGKDRAEALANNTEYIWNKDPKIDPFHQYLNSYPEEITNPLKAMLTAK
ncbi:MAG: DJ-1/PfpI family protein [Desulfovibrio sp.]